MPGILSNAGILKDQKLTDETWQKYVNDVKNTLSSGDGPLPFSFPCDAKLQPVKGADSLDLANEFAFPDFTRIWRARYEQMALSLDTEGDKPLAPMIFDPTAVASDLGVTISKPPSLSEVVSQIVGLLASQGQSSLLIPALTTLYADDASPELIAATAGLAAQPPITIGADALVQIIAPPIPQPPPLPSVSVPMPEVEPYIDQLRYEIALGLSPLKVHLEIMKSLANPLEIPNILSGLPTSIIEIACQAAGSAKPKPAESGAMKTSDVEKAAERTLIQHQVRLQSLVALGTTLGNGMLVKGLASAPLDKGGMGLIEQKTSAEEAPVKKFVGQVPSGTCPASRVNFHKRGRAIIETASQSIYPKRQLNKMELQIAQVIARHESSYGLANPGGTAKSEGLINNWGGVQCGVSKPPGTTCSAAQDKTSSGMVYAVSFVKYPSHEAGCADMLRHIMKFRPQTAKLLSGFPADNDNPGKFSDGATLFRIAYTLRREKYYESFCPNATKEYGKSGVASSLKFPDGSQAKKACAQEAITLWVVAQKKHLNEMLASNCLNEPIAFPEGTYEDAEEWYKYKNAIHI